MLTLAKETFIRRQTFTSGVEAEGFIKKLIKKGFMEGEERVEGEEGGWQGETWNA